MENYFSLLNDYYDKVYVVSVKAATERREQFDKRFKGLEYIYFFGADTSAFTIEEAAEKGLFDESLARYHHRFSKTMKHGEIACSLSHRYIYEDQVKNNYRRIMIFEDDAVPDLEALKNIPAIIKEIPENCELLMWGWDKNEKAPPAALLKKLVYHIKHTAGTLKWNHKMISNLFAKPYSAYLRKAGFHDYTYAYAINLSAAEKLIDLQTPVQYIADNLLAHAATNELVNSYIVYPKVFHHDNLPDGTHKHSYIR
jgi:glycosyl transferase family 25